MLDMARKAGAKTEGVARDIYEQDENLRRALTHLGQVIGEAARRVSPESCDEHPEIPWQVVAEDLPPLIGSLEGTLRPYSDTN